MSSNWLCVVDSGLECVPFFLGLIFACFSVNGPIFLVGRLKCVGRKIDCDMCPRRDLFQHECIE